MSTLASLRILLGLDSSDVSKGAGRVRGELTGVQKQANLSRDALRGVAAGLGIGAGLGTFQAMKRGVEEVTQVIGESVKAAIEEEAGIARLGQSLTANIAGFDGYTASIERTIAARQALGFADDEQRDSLARLVAATHDVNQALSIQATAMDLARFKGISLAEASDALIKVESGQFRALKALGIELRTGATQTEALAAVQAVAAGQAEKFGQQTAGAMAEAGVAIDNLKEDFGAKLMPILGDGARLITGTVLPTLGLASEGIQQLAEDALRATPLVGAFFDKVDTGSKTAGASLLDFLPMGGLLKQAYADIDAATIAAAEAQTQQTSEIDRGRQAWVNFIVTERNAEEATKAAAAATVNGATEINDLGLTATATAVYLKRMNDEIALIPRDIDVTLTWKVVGTPFTPSTALDAFEGGLTGAAGLPSNGGASTGDVYNDRLIAAAELAERQRQERERRAREAKTAGDQAAREAEASANKRQREAEQAAAERAREEQTRHNEMLADQFDAAKDKAREYFDTLHEGNQRAIDDIRDRANEELTAQQKAIRGVVSAEQARVNAVRAREQENTLRAAVASADTPEARTAAQRDLNRFLEDQKITRMSAAADISIALIEEEKKRNDAIAAEATKAENERAAKQRKAFDDEIARLQKHQSRYPEEWAKTQKDIDRVTRDFLATPAGAAGLGPTGLSVGPTVGAGASATAPGLGRGATTGIGTAATAPTFTLVQHIYIDGVLDRVERGQAQLQAIYNPTPPSASGKV